MAPQSRRAARQRAFHWFRREYNEERLQEYLEGKAPRRAIAIAASVPRAPPPIEYPGHYIVKQVTDAGTIRFKQKPLFLAKPLQTATGGPRGDH